MKRNSTFELEIYREQCPRFDRSEPGDYVFDHNANSTLLWGGGNLGDHDRKYGPHLHPSTPVLVYTALDRFRRSSFKDEALIWEFRLERNK